MLLTDKYADKIYGIIACYDCIIIQGYIPNRNHADAMTAYMKVSSISFLPWNAAILTDHGMIKRQGRLS